MRALAAEIKGGQVYVDGNIVASADKLCEDKTASNGYLIIDKDKVFYIVKTTEDLTKTLDILTALIDKLSSDILAANQGGAITAPTFQADLTQIKQQISQLKGQQV
jgi:hypothetical protein